MNIIVLVKQVPNTTEMKVDNETGTLIRTGVASIINPDDLASVECALQIKDKIKDTHIRVISMGPTQAKDMLVDLYGMGVDDCVLVSDRAFAGSDTWATSYTLSTAIKQFPYDLILAGRQAIDGDTAQVGPQIATRLNLPQITYVASIEDITHKAVTIIKSYEDFIEKQQCALPCLLTTLADDIEVRKGNITDTWNSLDKHITVLTNQELKCEVDHIGLAGSPTKVKKTFVKPVEKKGQMIRDDVELAAKTIADILIQASH